MYLILDPEGIFADANLSGDGMDGFSLIEQVRNNPSPNQHVPIIMLTAHSDQATMSNSFAAGATDFYVKPLTQWANVF